jgi:hypothetical protein
MKRIFLLLAVLSFILPLSGQVLTDSNLPIVIITTDNAASIPDEPGVHADMKIIDRGPGLRNYVTDRDSLRFLDYSGRIDIEIRGSYSSIFPKKGYGFTTLKPDRVTKNNVRLLGMPSENDWILDGISSDPSLIRNYLSYNLARQMGQYASRTEYCEVIINGNYKGLFILEEKIKSDKDRVDITKIAAGSNTLPELSGGYITKTDKNTGGDPIAWYMSSYYGYNDCNFIHSWPKPEAVTLQQNNYIRSVFLNLQTVCSAGNSSASTGYPSIIDIPSFIDFMLIDELVSNPDAYTYSTYYHKDRNGKLRAGPVWDMNLSFGNDLFELGFDRSKPDVWQFSNGSNEGPRYYRELFNSAPFKCILSRRWNQLIQPGQPFHPESLDLYIDSIFTLISEAAARDNARWGSAGNHQSAVTSIKAWLKLRIPWMTRQLGSFSACQDVATPPLVFSGINYHPETSVDFPESDKQEFLEITNAGALPVDLTGICFGGTGLVYQFPVGSSLPGGAAVFLAGDAATFEKKYGSVPFGRFTRDLSNDSEDLVLSDAFGNVIDRVHYSDTIPWPDADGNGMYLRLISITLDNSLASSWIAADEKTVGTNVLALDPTIHVYPNPTTGPVRIRTGFEMETLEITDMQGRVLAAYRVNEQDFTFDISRLPDGLYFVRVMTAKNIHVERVIKN